MDILVQQLAALFGDEEGRATAWSEMSIAPIGVAAQRGAGRRMQWHKPRLAELGQPDGQHACVEVDVVTLQPHCLGQTHARRRDQPERQGVALLMFRQPFGQEAQHQRVVDRQDAFQDREQQYDRQILRAESLAVKKIGYGLHNRLRDGGASKANK